MITESQVWEALPASGFLRDYVEYASGCTDANVAYHLAGGLVLIAQSTPTDLAVPFGTPLFSNLYTLVVGPSSESRKSASVKIAQSVLEAAIPNARGSLPGSVESLVDGLIDQPQQALFYEEFGSFLAGVETGYLIPLKTKLTEAFDASNLSRKTLGKKRKGQGSICVNPRLSILGASTPGYLEHHSDPVDWVDGFFARFFTILADRERYIALPARSQEKFEGIVNTLQTLREPVDSPVSLIGQCRGYEAKARTIWSNWNSGRSGGAKVASEAQGAVARAGTLALKIGLLLGWSNGKGADGLDWLISEAEMAVAVKITDLHVQSILTIAERLAGSEDMRIRRRVLDAVEADPTTLGKILRTAKVTKRKVREYLETLMEEGEIVRTATPAGGEAYRRRDAADTGSIDGPDADVIPIHRATSGVDPVAAEAFSASGAEDIFD